MEQYAYIRVSTKEQNVERQIFALEPYHIPKKNIYCDYQSGKDFERPAYQKLLKKLKAGDLMIVKSIDRLGRNYNDILIQWQYITKEIKADILVLDMELLDTRFQIWYCKSLPMLPRQKENLFPKGKWKELKQRNAKAKNLADQKKKCRKNLKKFAGDVNRENYLHGRQQNCWESVIRLFTGDIEK